MYRMSPQLREQELEHGRALGRGDLEGEANAALPSGAHEIKSLSTMRPLTLRWASYRSSLSMKWLSTPGALAPQHEMLAQLML